MEAEMKHANSCGTSPMSSETISTENLRVLLAKTLQNKSEDRELRARLRIALLYLTVVLERFSINPLDHIEKYSKVDIAIEKSDKTLLSSYTKFSALQEGVFGFGTLNSKAVQSTLSTSSVTSSKLIQTQFDVDLPQFDIVGFKIDLIKHMRTLKQDVLILRQLLFTVENYSVWGSHGRFRMPKETIWKEDELDINFSRAKMRATNFVKFYKLQTNGNKKRRSCLNKTLRLSNEQKTNK